MIHHRPQAVDAYVRCRGLLMSSAVIDGCLLLSLTLPFGWVEGVGTRSFSPNAFIRNDSDGREVIHATAALGTADSMIE
jgi:hypothetical protein